MWLHCLHRRGTELVERLGKEESRSVSHYVVHPEDTLADLLGKVRESVDDQLYYEKSPLKDLLQDSNRVLMFSNVDCNPLLSIELEEMCLSRSVVQNGEILPIACKIVIMSGKSPKLMVKNKISSSLFSEKRLPGRIAVESMAEKATELNRLLDRCPVFEINGRSGMGKSYLLSHVLNTRNSHVISLSCSPVLEREEVEKRLIEWLDCSGPSTLVIDHYDVMVNGYWDLLVPNQCNVVSICGKDYVIPKDHQCVLIKSGSQTKDHVVHRAVKDLPSVTFSDYPTRDVVEVVKTFRTDGDIQEVVFRRLFYFSKCFEATFKFSRYIDPF